MAGAEPSWIPYGPTAALFKFSGNHSELARITAALEKDLPEGILEYVPGLSTLLLIFAASRDFSLPDKAEKMLAWMKKAVGDSGVQSTLHEIPVLYNGPDLKEIAESHGLSEDEVISIHSGTLYTVHMLGFSPGFPYLGPLDSRLHTPRKAVPRSRITPGSVAIGGPHTGIYTVETAGGWHLIGQTQVKIFDSSRSTPGNEGAMFLLHPGDQVRFLPQS